jgi:hypothetical protein
VALIVEIGTVPVQESQLELWRRGCLGSKWARIFNTLWPHYFDAEFRRFYEHQGKRTFNPDGTVRFDGGYGFFEPWRRLCSITRRATCR